MKKLSKLLFALILTFMSPLCLNSSCFGKNSCKSATENSKKPKENQVKPIEYKTQKIDENKTKVNISMYIPCPKKKKIDMESIKICDPKNGEITNICKKVSKVDIGKKSYIKVEFSYIVEIKNKKQFLWPVPGFKTITSGFNDSQGRLHTHGAIDIAGSGIYGAKVVASNAGRVVVANAKGWGGGYGKYVVIDHGNGESTLYGHMSNVCVKNGENISAGQKIGKVGSTGFSECPHLHFEYRVNGVRTNPSNILDINE